MLAKPRPVRWITAAARLAHDLVDFALPQRCAGCGVPCGPPLPLCPACLGAIPRLSLELCARCLARGREPAGCLAHPGFAVRPAWVYDERAELVVHALKYQGRVRLASALGGELARAVSPARGVQLVTEVPLHPARRRERGYNQSALLAERLADAIGAPWLPAALERVRPTRAQARLRPDERRRNMAGAFRVRRPGWLRERRIVIVDDVVTTGATLEACLAVLVEAGARPSAVTLAWAQ
jgi:ComF family protein